MTFKLGRTRNVSDTVVTNTYTINSTTATKIADVNDRRVYFSATLAPGNDDIDVIIRYYPAAQDNTKHGTDVLTRYRASNDNRFHLRHVMTPDTIYTGEISAICQSGSVDIFVTEFVEE